MKAQALKIADEILQREPEFFRLSKRHIGIYFAHSELWCAVKFNLDLPSSGVSSGEDATATSDAIFPFRKNDTIQIKARDHRTMHITFKPKGIHWLLVVTYNIEVNPVRVLAYLFSVSEFIELAKKFKEEAGTSVIPLKVCDNGDLRLEWSTLRSEKIGVVKRSTDTWEARRERCSRVLSSGYEYMDGKFKKGIVGSFKTL